MTESNSAAIDLGAVCDAYVKVEFVDKDVAVTMATMASRARAGVRFLKARIPLTRALGVTEHGRSPGRLDPGGPGLDLRSASGHLKKGNWQIPSKAAVGSSMASISNNVSPMLPR
jgi:hypothetical protein